MSAIKNSEIFGKKSIFNFGLKYLNKKPKTTGKKTIKNADFINKKISILMFCFDKSKISIGVIITEIRVEQKVLIIDNATFPLHK